MIFSLFAFFLCYFTLCALRLAHFSGSAIADQQWMRYARITFHRALFLPDPDVDLTPLDCNEFLTTAKQDFGLFLFLGWRREASQARLYKIFLLLWLSCRCACFFSVLRILLLVYRLICTLGGGYASVNCSWCERRPLFYTATSISLFFHKYRGGREFFLVSLAIITVTGRRTSPSIDDQHNDVPEACNVKEFFST